jgi:integrase
MSSITRRPNGHRWIFYKFQGKRHTLRLGKIDDKLADWVKSQLDRLLEFRQIGMPPDADLSSWLFRLDNRIHSNLVQSGLADPRGPSTLGALIKAHDASLIARGVKPSTLCNNRVLHANILGHFGAPRRLTSITLQEAEKFKLFMLERGGRSGGPLAKATVSNRLRRAKAIFAYAIKNDWLKANPFTGVTGGVEVNTARDAYITPEIFTKIINCSADRELRFLLALVRYCGLRCPSEIQPLRWSAIDWEGGVMVVHSSKTEAYGDNGRREVPMFAVVVPYLLDAWEFAPNREELMFPRHQGSGAAITNRLASLCRKAGEVLWPKPFVNLRASAERDCLKAGHQIDKVAPWFGHSPIIALRHYNRVFKEREARAAAGDLRASTPPDDPKYISMYRIGSLRFVADDCGEKPAETMP